MPRRSTHHTERTANSKGQSLVEFAIMLPVLLLIFGAALDLGRLFYVHVAIENAAKEGALYGASNPARDGPTADCSDPNNVRWHVETESIGIPDVASPLPAAQDRRPTVKRTITTRSRSPAPSPW